MTSQPDKTENTDIVSPYPEKLKANTEYGKTRLNLEQFLNELEDASQQMEMGINSLISTFNARTEAAFDGFTGDVFQR